ncbi:MAG: tRNA 5-methoxyuridine(34)/uridine 5-oxyacetic acid(34) synthase CmoB [Thiohalomonadales bacterium]
MLNYHLLAQTLKSLDLTTWFDAIEPSLHYRLSAQNHGDFPRWQESLHSLPDLHIDTLHLELNTVTLLGKTPPSTLQSQQLKTALQGLQPWRKGPFDIFGTFIDTEWRSDFKWRRLLPHISSLKDKTVLDIGCGNGYHLWRMLGAGAKTAIGIDPSILFTAQFAALNRYIQTTAAFVLPLGVDEVASDCQAFDSVFSMGVLYHRQSPIEHLFALKGFLRAGGELILETLVIDPAEGDLLFPKDRYAQMRNVWFIPSSELLCRWLSRCGFVDIRIIDVSRTTVSEQRTTEWMPFNSLTHFLDANNSSKTIEGYPAPTRAIVLAKKPA